jgi:CBS domain-containing protein
VSVEEVMNPHPVILQDSMPIKDAVHKMLDANVSGAPVVDDQGSLVGVLTEADVIWKGAGAPEDHYIIPPVFIGFADAFIYLRDNKRFDEEVHKILARTVSEAMSGKDKVISVTPTTAMSEAAHLMLHNDVNLLPVVESGNKVVGIVTRHDILRGIYASKSPFL